MNQTDLDILLREGEGSMLEYKESFSSSLARDLVAFANSTGGKILLGIRDDGSIVGIKDDNKIRAQIQDIARNCDPPVQILLETFGKVMKVVVRESENKPVQCRDGFFWRQGASTQKLTRDEIKDFFQSEGAVRFDMNVCPNFRYPEDFDLDKYNKWIRQSQITPSQPIEDVLINIEVAERSGGRFIFRNAGVLFFAKNVHRFFPQAYVTCLLAEGRDKVNILDRKDFTDGLVNEIEESLHFITRNTRTAYRIEGLRRKEVPEYPMRALREAITNAIMHRDYFEVGANVFIEIYRDRIEISNPGGLPKGLSRKDFGTRSVRRNPLIADLLHRIGFIEKAGTGIRRMREDAKANECPIPSFTHNGFFTAIFRPAVEKIDEDIQKIGTKLGLSRDQARVLDYCHSERSFTDVMRLFKRTNRTKFRDQVIRPLIDASLLAMSIPDKPKSPKQRYKTTSLGRKIHSKKPPKTRKTK